jgi:hypothetical protein
MADDAAAPTGELSEPNKPRSGTDQGSAESPDAAAAEPESTAASDVEDAEDYDTEGDDAADNPDPKKRRTPR